MPKALRYKWLNLLRHHKVKLSISSCAGKVPLGESGDLGDLGKVGAPSATSYQELRPFPKPKIKSRRGVKDGERNADGSDGSF